MSLSRFRTRWLLPASLTFNIFLCAAFLVHLGQEWRRQPPLPPPPDAILEEMIRDLSPADGKILRDGLALGLSEVDRAHRAEEALPQRLQSILGQEPFDKAAFHDLLEQSQRARETLNAALPETLERLSPEGRRRLAQWRPPPPPGAPPGPPH
ncbi:periplasmic heavy metal sensor [Telmatospirillum siberiense]|uniref:Periplasmic heavy metal sensor n=1 Tax=Telmatospirillum siberiense TaxID=382514 RepID=A0A2N3PVF5_9PROT|nr:periplasmic heavy metal sensor [Telmatospirillum siberiense]PKU24370.1 hypothetical protein CWS72_12330 [Telmatospirillum siberiense]